jgi:hypothetical protein
MLHHARAHFRNIGDFAAAQAKPSPVHICCGSALKTKLWVDDRADSETAKASTKPA